LALCVCVCGCNTYPTNRPPSQHNNPLDDGHYKSNLYQNVLRVGIAMVCKL
jgi:hypothetical protein